MDHRPRPLARLLIGVAAPPALFAAALAACAQGAASPVGVSDHDHGRAVARDGGGDAAAPRVDLPDYRATFRKVTDAPIATTGHAPGAWQLEAWANDAGFAALSERTAAVGAFLVVEQRPIGRPSDPPVVMALEKRPAGYAPEHGDVRYVVVDRRGQLVSDGSTEGCWGCHDDAPLDRVFPIASPDGGVDGGR